MEELLRYRWPGNVREMKNVIERAVVLAQGDYVDHEDSRPFAPENRRRYRSHDERRSHVGYEPESLADIEKKHIARTLKATGWNKSKAASILGIERSTLDRKIKRYELRNERPRM